MSIAQRRLLWVLNRRKNKYFVFIGVIDMVLGLTGNLKLWRVVDIRHRHGGSNKVARPPRAGKILPEQHLSSP